MTQTRTRRHVCFVTIVEGDLAGLRRGRCESSLFERLAAAAISVSMVSVNDAGCMLAVDEYDLSDLRSAVQGLNVALRVRTRCARISAVRREPDPPVPTAGAVIAAMTAAGIGVIHLAAGAGDLCVLVDERDAVRAQAVLSCCAGATPLSAA